MNDLFRFYNDILSKLPISLVGYEDVNHEINSFFYKLTRDSYFKSYDNITFFSYSLTKLLDASTWKTDLLSHEFFFEAFKKRNSRIILSFYYYLKEKYGIAYNTITSLSTLFAKDISFRISCTDNKKLIFYYDQKRNLLSFEIPNYFLKSDKYDIAESEYHRIMTLPENLNNCYVTQNESIYYKVPIVAEQRNVIYKAHNNFFEQGFNITAIGSLDDNNALLGQLNEELESFASLNEDLFVDSKDKSELIKYWISQFISIAYLAGHYNCWVEYMPATVGIFNFRKSDGTIKSEHRNLGSFIIGYNKEQDITLEERAIYKLISERISLAVGGTHFIDLIKERETQATRAAISQVMARNTSHNIGAHVMNNLIHGLDKLKFEDLKNYKSVIILPKSDEALLSQMALFNNYIKCRMDYLADIALGTSQMQTNKFVYGDIFKDLDKVRLLLENIAGLPGFSYSIVFKRDGEILTEKNDLLVAIPNDILGMQAFYNILENIIRNTAKHSDKTALRGQRVEFTVNFIDKNNAAINGNETEINNILTEFVAVEIYDNVPIIGMLDTVSDEDKQEYLSETGDNGEITRADFLVFKQNNQLNKDILSDNKKLRTYSLGLVEMDASAAYMRQRDVSFINHPSYEIEYNDSWSRNSELNSQDPSSLRGKNCRYFIKAFKKIENNNNYLGYRFFLHRPAVLLIITNCLDDGNEESKMKKNKLKSNGIWVVTPAEFVKHLKERKVYNHDFVINTEVQNDDINTTIENYKTSLPIRILHRIENINNLIEESATKIEEECWKEWTIYTKMNEIQFDIANGVRSNGKFHAVFLDHLDSPGHNPINDWTEVYEANYVEALSSLAQIKMPDFYRITRESTQKDREGRFQYYVGSVNNSSLVKNKIMEAAMNVIVVIDERIQQAAYNHNFMGIKYSETYIKMNVRIPGKEINLSADSYTADVIEAIENYIQKEIKDSKLSDFILIHYSILERMYGKDGINAGIKNLTTESNINVVLTSGRGTPNDLSENVRFVNLSSVITAFVEVRSKYAINYLLNSSRKAIIL